MKYLLCIALVALGFSSPSLAHDKWKNGDDVPDWVNSACCSKADAHLISSEQVHTVPGGYKVDGYFGDSIIPSIVGYSGKTEINELGEKIVLGSAIIPFDYAKPSLDGEYWIFYSNWGTKQSRIYCFFLPSGA